jgi:leader peptidase (prepilin peptidase)/N-methyltransferase
LRDAVIGAIAGYLTLWLVYWLFKLIRGKDGHGLRRLQAARRPRRVLGWQMLPLIVLLSSVVGAAIGISLVVFKGRDHQTPLAFGPLPGDRRRDCAFLRPIADTRSTCRRT